MHAVYIECIFCILTIDLDVVLNNSRCDWGFKFEFQEEIAAVNLTKYRKAQQELQDAEERASNDTASVKIRARMNSGSRNYNVPVRPLIN